MLSLNQSSLSKRGLEAPVARKTPSASSFTIKEGQSHTPDRDTSDRERFTPRAQRHQKRELTKQSKWEWESPADILCEDEAPRKRTRRIKKGVSTRQQLQNLKIIADYLRHGG